MMSLLPALDISKIAAQGVDFDNYIEINEIGRKAPPTLNFKINVCKIPNVQSSYQQQQDISVSYQEPLIRCFCWVTVHGNVKKKSR